MDTIIKYLLLLATVFVLTLVWTILAKLYFLPVVMYRIIVPYVFPVWMAEHSVANWVIIAVLVLLPTLYWVLRLVHWVQEERAIREYLLNTAIPLEGYEQIET